MPRSPGMGESSPRASQCRLIIDMGIFFLAACSIVGIAKFLITSTSEQIVDQFENPNKRYLTGTLVLWAIFAICYIGEYALSGRGKNMKDLSFRTFSSFISKCNQCRRKFPWLKKFLDKFLPSEATCMTVNCIYNCLIRYAFVMIFVFIFVLMIVGINVDLLSKHAMMYGVYYTITYWQEDTPVWVFGQLSYYLLHSGFFFLSLELEALSYFMNHSGICLFAITFVIWFVSVEEVKESPEKAKKPAKVVRPGTGQRPGREDRPKGRRWR